MKKHITDEKTGIRYTLHGDYYLPDFALPAQAEDMFSRLVKEYADRQEVTERLKAENQLLWVGKMNNIRACVRSCRA